MSWTPEEPLPKRRRLADEQHSDSFSDTNVFQPWYLESHVSPLSCPSSWTALPGQMTGFQFQQGTQVASWLPPGTMQESRGTFDIPQPYERATDTNVQSEWGRMPYLAPRHMPHHGHVWHNPAPVLPMHHYYYSQGVTTLPTQNTHFPGVKTEKATTPLTTASVIDRKSPSPGLVFDYVPSDGTTDLGPGATDSSMEETVCFGMV